MYVRVKDLKSGTQITMQKPWNRKWNLSCGRIFLILLKGREDLQTFFFFFGGEREALNYEQTQERKPNRICARQHDD